MAGIYHVSEARKIKEHRGEGIGRDYKPWIYVREVKSEGTSSEPVDWITGRTCQLLSQGEKYLWYYLRWDDTVKNIYEQYPLNLDVTNSIAINAGIKPMLNGKQHMTTDFYVEYQDGHYEAFSVKDSRRVLDGERMVELQFVEMQYWEQSGIPWHIVYKEDLNADFVKNIEIITTFFRINDVYDVLSYTKYLLARKLLKTDLYSGVIDVNEIYTRNLEDINEQYTREFGNTCTSITGNDTV